MDKATLRADGYVICITFRKFKGYDTSLDTIVAFSVDSSLSQIEATSIPMPMRLKDIQALIDYFEQHIANLQDNPWSDSATFVPLDLHFQMQALAGEVSSPDDGAFSLRCMVNVGQVEGCSRTYVGGEASVSLEQVSAFTSSLRAVLKKYNY